MWALNIKFGVYTLKETIVTTSSLPGAHYLFTESIGTQSSRNASFLGVRAHRVSAESNLISVVSTVTRTTGSLSWSRLGLKNQSPRSRQRCKREAEYHTGTSVCSSVSAERRKSHIPALSVVTEDAGWTMVLLLMGNNKDPDFWQLELNLEPFNGILEIFTASLRTLFLAKSKK